MSQTIVPPAPAGGPLPSAVQPGPAGGPPSATFRGRLASASATIRHYLSGSPGRLRIISGLAVVAAVLVALGGGAALRERSGALDEARSSATHLLLLQTVQINLVQANADVTNSFLKFGLEPEDQRLDYIAKIQDASRDLAEAADASAADARVLGQVNADLTRYTGYIGSARANNRAGNPVGANYLGTASDLLLGARNPDTGELVTEGMVARFEERAQADRDKITAAYSRAGRAALWLGLVALIGLGVLIWSQLYLARHSRRILNIPLAAATVGLLVALIAAGGAMAVAQSKANDVRDGSLANATALSDSRVAAFTAKSTESLTLIQRGSAKPEDKIWTDAMADAVKLPRDNAAAEQALAAYSTAHKVINAADVKGNWDQAVAAAVAAGTAEKPTANSQFSTYVNQTSEALDEQRKAVLADLGDAGNALLPTGILVVLFGLLAAIGAWWGISLRLDEYR